MSWVKLSIAMRYWLENKIIYVKTLQLNPVQAVVPCETILSIPGELANWVGGTLPYATYTFMSLINI